MALVGTSQKSFQKEIRTNSTSSSEKKQASAHTTKKPTNSKVHPRMTRSKKEIGSQPQNQKRQVGNSAERDAEPDSRISCTLCGFRNDPANDVCYRCTKAFEKIKSAPQMQIQTRQSSGVSGTHQPQAKGSHGTRRRYEHHTRQAKHTPSEAPQCITLSSDEEDPDVKKRKQETAANQANPSHIFQDNPAMDSDPTLLLLTHKAVDKFLATTENLSKCAGQVKKSTASYSGPYFLLDCHNVRIGSYACKPSGSVLFCSEGFHLKLPTHDKIDGLPQTADITIETKNLQEVRVYFGNSVSVIILQVKHPLCRSISRVLGVKDGESSPYFDSLSVDECKKRITLFPSKLDNAAINAIKQAFMPKGVFREIDSRHTY